MSETPPRRPHAPSSRAPSPPGESTTRWEGGCVTVAALVQASADAANHELVLWVESDTGRIVGARFVATEELPGAAAAVLRDAIEHPLSGAPRRPAEILVQDGQLADELRPASEELRLRLRVVPECRRWSAVVAEFGAFLAAHWPGRSYLAGRAVTADGVERLFQAAAAFYRSAPWRVLEEAPIELRLAERRRPVYAVVLGNSRMVHGLTLYLSAAALRTRDADAHPVRSRDTIALTFDREDGIPPPMLEERRAHRWPLAGPAAFPLPYRQLADGTMREPDAADLDLLTVALHAVAEFATRRPTAPADGQPIVEAVQVHGASGDAIARLTFPAQLPPRQRGNGDSGSPPTA